MTLKKFTTVGACALLLALPSLAEAATVTLYNPLGESDIRVIIGRVISGILSIVGSVALLMFIYGGTLWLTSAGMPDRVKKGKDILTWATLGLGVIFASYAAVNAVLNALTRGNVTGT